MSTPRQEIWEQRYASAERLWTGRTNEWIDLLASLTPGRSLDIGSGEGADVLWLAERGWHATGVDFSPTAVRRLREHATAQGLAERVEASVLDVAHEPLPQGPFDLITSFFLHGGPGPDAVDLAETLSQAARRVAPGGHLMVTTHSQMPAWWYEHARAYTAEELGEMLAPETRGWQTVLREERAREVASEDGQTSRRANAVLLLRRPA